MYFSVDYSRKYTENFFSMYIILLIYFQTPNTLKDINFQSIQCRNFLMCFYNQQK